MNNMRERAKTHFPTVLLTLLSIVQALALELLWAHVTETDYLYAATWSAAVSWLQICATFLGIILIWVVYASNVTRFSWVPSTSDSVLPFLIGILQFLMVETLGPGGTGQWLMVMAAIFGGMTWISQHTMRRARQDKDNASFFRSRPPAQWRDFYQDIAVVSAFAGAGLYVWATDEPRGFVTLTLLATLALLSWQYLRTARWWENSIREE